MIENKINKKVYIGSSFNIKQRWRSHKRDLKNQKHHSYHLQNSWNKYGEDNFKFSILVKTKKNKKIIIKIEQKYIDFYQSSNRKNGYNINPRAESTAGRVISSKERELRSKTMTRRWKENRSEMMAARERVNKEEWIKNLSRSLIENGSRKGEKNSMYRKNCHKIWTEKFGKEKADEMWKETLKKNSKANSKENNAMWNKKRTKVGELNKLLKSIPILQFSLGGDFIQEFQGVSEAARVLNIKRSSIRNFNKNKNNIAAGFIWKYKN